MLRHISIAEEFTRFPGGRYRKNGKGSGEEFREEVLLPLMRRNESAVIDLEGTSGYPPSFLEEAFGGLVRAGFSADQIRKQIQIRAGPKFESYTGLIWGYVDKAERQHIRR